jgi:thiol-disulfide isomerase/thioredoxin
MKKGISITIVALVIILGGSYFLNTKSTTSGKYDTFATCIANSGAQFFGAFWCPHCREQKELFESSAKLLPYIECSTPDGQGQKQVCTDKEIKSYPTWIFANGERLTGTLEFAELAQKTACPLPDGVSAVVATSTVPALSSSTLPVATTSATVQ